MDAEHTKHEFPTISRYQDQERLLVALDVIIFGFEKGELKLLLIKRDFEPEQGRWSLMGGFLHPEETLETASQRILQQLTGLDQVYLEQLHIFSDLNRDPVERTLSVAYFALINVEEHDPKLVKDHGASWFSATDYPNLIFDHQKMVEKAKERLRHKASYYPIGFELLPEKFTLPQLHSLYEAIFEQALDKRNFSRRLHSMDLLIKLDEKQKGVSKKGAWYYKFDPQKYQQLLQNGSGFLLKP